MAERSTEDGCVIDRSVTVANKAQDGRAAHVVAFVSTGCGDASAKKQLAGRGIQQGMS